MLVLGLETSCDETGVALYHTERGLLAHALYSQVAMHSEYGGVVPELASRDHIRRLMPLVRDVLKKAGCGLHDLNAISYTQGPGLAGALLVGASFGTALGFSLGIPAIGVHHMEGHLLSPFLSEPAPGFPFVALLVSGGHTQLMQVNAFGDYRLLGETVDDAAGEAFDKTAKLLGLGYPGGPALSELALGGSPRRFKLPRPMLRSGDLNFSFSGLKTAVALLATRQKPDPQTRADIALAFQEAIVEVLAEKSLAALAQTGLKQLVVAGGVGANRQLREALAERSKPTGIKVYYPRLEFCTDNGAMIAYAGAMRLEKTGLRPASSSGETIKESGTAAMQGASSLGFTVRPRWDLELLNA